MRQEVLNIPSVSMQVKHADNTYFNIKEPLIRSTDIQIQLGKQTVNYIKSQGCTENELTGVIQPSPDLEDTDDLIICPALTTSPVKQCTELIINFLKHPFKLKK